MEELLLAEIAHSTLREAADERTVEVAAVNWRIDQRAGRPQALLTDGAQAIDAKQQDAYEPPRRPPCQQAGEAVVGQQPSRAA